MVEIKQDAQTGEIKEVSQVIDAQGGRVKEGRMSQGEFDQLYGRIAEYAGTITILKFTKPNPGNCTTYCSGGWCDTFCW